jgi:hypothetical protein
MTYSPQLASKRAFRRFKRKFHSEAFNGLGLGLVAFVRYWFAIKRMRKQNAKEV